ncbi:uncharacterized protein C8Q71DRAFT_857850 [Rhodofomes roseus]|uniref:Uncharacterized protein n=1 Tax=Rhodofomes roseus TaxID=34475 RepID=A0ABQ8KG34_9APHY|nr:uncharacterized protein C8Q71DRAFT_857850 [Rhodofomes roseus]KAH9836630.1 hypothetical protein C8Q71DRAFT_857850 [Rhodofomes roseus]
MLDVAMDGSGHARELQYYHEKAKHLVVNPESFTLSDEAHQYLDLLTDIAELLGVDDISFSSYSAAIQRLTMDELAARRSSLHLGQTEQELVAHLASLCYEEDLIKHWKKTITAEPEPHASVSVLERRRAALTAKIKEYQAEEEALKRILPSESSVTVTELATIHKQIKVKDKTLAEKRAKVAAFQGLPPSIELARHELRRARDEQLKLIQLRERLLDRMASGVS